MNFYASGAQGQETTVASAKIGDDLVGMEGTSDFRQGYTVLIFLFLQLLHRMCARLLKPFYTQSWVYH